MLYGKTTQELLAIRRTRRFTPVEREVMFGGFAASSDRDAELVRRLDAGLPLSKGDATKARRIKKGKH